VVTPSLALLAVLLLTRAAADYRGWLLIAAALALGFAWTLAIDAVLKPAIVTAIYVWLAWLMAAPGRWRALVEGDQPQRSGAGAMASAVAGTGHR
jgi:predicted membrane-bound mannosyltransferase